MSHGRLAVNPSPLIRAYDFDAAEFWPQLAPGEALTQIVCSPGSPPSQNVTQRYLRTVDYNGHPAYLLNQYAHWLGNQQLYTWFVTITPNGVYEFADDYYESGVFVRRVFFPINTLIWGGKQKVGDFDIRAADIIAAYSINVGADILGRSAIQFAEHLFDFEDVMGNVWPEAIQVINYQEFPRVGHGSPGPHHIRLWFAKDDQGRGCGHVQVQYRTVANEIIRTDAIDQNRWGLATDPLP